MSGAGGAAATATTSMVQPLKTNEDVVRARQMVREQAGALRFGLVDQTKLVTAASELARNTITYGQGGEMQLTVVERAGARGLRLTFIDQGPGIEDIARALTDGYTSGGGMGLGLPGSKRLVNEFHVDSAPGEGTRVSITKWK